MDIVLIGIGLLVFLAHLFTALFEKTRLPDVLPLVVLGLLLGPLMGLISPDALGKAGRVFTTVSLVIILFQGGLGLRLSALWESMGPGSRLTAANFLASIAASAAIAKLVLGFPLIEGCLLGTIVGGISSAVVIPMIGMLRLQERTRTALFLESAFSDVLCIVVTLALLQAIKAHEMRAGAMLGQILASFTLSSALGILGGVFWSTILDRVRRLENSLFTTPAFVCIVFGLAELLGYSGAIAALAFGVMLGNIDFLSGLRLPSGSPLARLRPVQFNQTEEALFAELVFLLKTFFFVYIGLSIRVADTHLILAGSGLTLLLFLVRIPVIWLALDRSTSRKDACVAAAMAPKGLAAAVLASLPLQSGLERGAQIQDLVYTVVLISIAITTALTYFLEKKGTAGVYGRVFSDYPMDSADAAADS